ncbi:SPOR domain-containing protein [Paenibacillus sp. SYP-B3998]|uniref:SPOR domain-containing protein n=1 Tax=Paenibacillus sp. SYP-B3998 TaxID=2678564 RepID=A0A6G3ZR26_9BACL|nr:SPOR domain-containing protein [Paenibacillus sp. SYP-B3998]NEW04488.1 SPOR domain-containing protein [Paenibacillus sp. SYP-B3998]
MNKARITYRFNQTDQSESSGNTRGPSNKEDKVIPLYQEEFAVIETQEDESPSVGSVTPTQKAERQQVESMFESHALNTFTTDFGNWNSSIETEGQRVERIIRESQTTAEKPVDRVQSSDRPTPEKNNNPEDWTTWTNRGPWVEPEVGARYAKSSGTPWIRIATSVAGAVITGVAFGFFVLSMFSTERQQGETIGKNTVTVASPNVQTTVPSKAAAGTAVTVTDAPKQSTNQAPAIPAATGNITQVQIPAKTYAFLQNGVFSSLSSAQAAQDSLKKKGLASALDGSEKLVVFVGFAQSRDEALALSQRLQVQDKSLEVYIKNVEIPAASEIRWSGKKPETFGSFIAQGDKLIRSISGVTVAHLGETKPTALPDSSLQMIRSSHQSLTALSASVNEGLGDEGKPLVHNMTTALGSAVQAMEEYKKTPSTAILWQAQSSMMQYIIAQKELLKNVVVS